MKMLIVSAAFLGALFALTVGGLLTFNDEFADRYVRVVVEYRVLQRVAGPLILVAGVFMLIAGCFVAVRRW
jgi:hypothetical protein